MTCTVVKQIESAIKKKAKLGFIVAGVRSDGTPWEVVPSSLGEKASSHTLVGVYQNTLSGREDIQEAWLARLRELGPALICQALDSHGMMKAGVLLTLLKGGLRGQDVLAKGSDLTSGTLAFLRGAVDEETAETEAIKYIRGRTERSRDKKQEAIELIKQLNQDEQREVFAEFAASPAMREVADAQKKEQKHRSTIAEIDEERDLKVGEATKKEVFGDASPSITKFNRYLHEQRALSRTDNRPNCREVCRAISQWKDQFGSLYYVAVPLYVEAGLDDGTLSLKTFVTEFLKTGQPGLPEEVQKLVDNPESKVTVNAAIRQATMEGRTVLLECTVAPRSEAAGGGYKLRQIGQEQAEMYSRVTLPHLICLKSQS